MKLTLKSLKSIVYKARNFRYTDVVDGKSKEIYDIAMIYDLFSILLTLYFGEYNTSLIWKFINAPEESEFDCEEKLYEYLSDKYSELVNKDKALTLDQLRALFPEEKMFEYFDNIIKKYGGKKGICHRIDE